jgi:SWI/SNF-related matrix-associated actin-dependent regulator of chromatin subfamily A3
MGDLIEPLPPSELTQALPLVEDEEDDDDEFRNGSSAKIDHLIYLLRSLPTNEKSLVFSQFTSFLDKVSGRGNKLRESS